MSAPTRTSPASRSVSPRAAPTCAALHPGSPFDGIERSLLACSRRSRKRPWGIARRLVALWCLIVLGQAEVRSQVSGSARQSDAGTLGSSKDAIPSLIYSLEYQPDPIFVAAEYLTEDVFGNVDLSAGPEGTTLTAQSYFARAPLNGPCLTVNSAVEEGNRPPSDHRSLSAVVADCTVLVEGTVSGLKAGFSWMRPGTVVAIEDVKVLEGSWQPRSLSVMFFMPVGRVSSPSRCLEIVNESWIPVPPLGATVMLLFEGEGVFNATSPMLNVVASGVISFAANSQAEVPPVLEPELGAGVSKDEILRRARLAFERERQRERPKR
jgi:hypothetical protein